jgi:hypothetical protein
MPRKPCCRSGKSPGRPRKGESGPGRGAALFSNHVVEPMDLFNSARKPAKKPQFALRAGKVVADNPIPVPGRNAAGAVIVARSGGGRAGLAPASGVRSVVRRKSRGRPPSPPEKSRGRRSW